MDSGAKVLLFFDICKRMSKKKFFLLSKVKGQRQTLYIPLKGGL